MKSAAYTINRLARKYNVNRIWLWDIVEENWNIIKGIGGWMEEEEIRELERIVRM